MERDSRIRGIRLPRNMKAPTASNRAIDAARGEWIAVLDADDWMLPNRLVGQHCQLGPTPFRISQF